MKKRLLMQLLVLASVVGAYAENIGDYIFTASAKYQVTGANIFVNGDFSQGVDATWTNESGEPVSGDTWGVETGLGPNGENVIKSKGASVDEGSLLHFVQPISQGLYTFSFWVKAPSTVLSNVNPLDVANLAGAATNAVRFFLSEDGSNTEATLVANQAAFTTEWSRVVFTVEVASDSYLVFNAANLATETMFTNFEIYPVIEVYDTRIADRAVAFAKKLVAEPDLSKEPEEVQGYIAAIEETLAAGEVDATTMDDLITALNVAIEDFLSINAGNTVGTTVEGIKTERYLYDWHNSGYIQYNSMTVRGNWTFDGGRWGFSPNDESLSRPVDDGWVASAGVQRGYELNVGMHITDSTFATTSLKPGKYMFSVEAQAVAAQYSSNADVAAYSYGANEAIEIAGPWMWVGNDTIAFRPATATDAVDHPTWKFAEETTVLNNRNWQRLYYIADIKEDELIGAGFHFPVLDGLSGGRYSLRNPEFRVVGKSQEEVDHLYAFDQLVINRDVLKGYLDLAAEDNAKTQADGFPWGHAILQDSIAKFTDIYNGLLTVIDANNTELQPEKVTLAYKDEILAAISSIRSARTNFANTNKVFTNLIADIATCTETMNDAAYAAGDKTTFKGVIDKAQALVDNTKYDVDQTDDFNAMDDELLTARQVFMMITASRANPVDLNYTLRNASFTAWTTNQNITSATTSNYWNFATGDDFKQWQLYASDAFESGRNCNQWRGTSVGPNGKVWQTFTLDKAGVYEFRSKAYATDDTWSQYLGIAKVMYNMDIFTGDTEAVCDTIYNPSIKLFFGPNGATNDSLRLYKCSPVILSSDSVINMDRYRPLSYSIIYIKTTDTPEECELGLQALGNGASSGANAFGFGDNHLYYLGSEAAYTSATQAAFDEEVAKAKALIAKYKDATLKVGSEDLKKGLINSMYRYMGEKDLHPCETKSMLPDVVTIQDKQNSIISLQEQEALLELLATYEVQETGISATGINELPVATGVYNLTGLKVGNSVQDLKNLGKGIYIVNGKKYLVK